MFPWWDNCFVCRVWNDFLLVLEVVVVEEVVVAVVEVEEVEEAVHDLQCKFY